MKTLCLATLLIVGYSSLSQIKSFDDLRGIDSEEAFIRVCLENGYESDRMAEYYKITREEWLKEDHPDYILVMIGRILGLVSIEKSIQQMMSIDV